MKLTTILSEKGHEVVTLNSDISLWSASCTLDKHKIGATVVLDDMGHPCGVLSERDIVRRISELGSDALQMTVENAMTRSIVTATPDMEMDEALALMTDRRIRHLPVVEDDKLVGIVSIGDLVKRKITAAEAEAEAMKQYIHTR